MVSSVAADVVVVGAHVLVAETADQDRAGHQVERLPAHAVAEAALAHVGQRMHLVQLGERVIARPRGAAVIVDLDGFVLQYRLGAHMPFSPTCPTGVERLGSSLLT
jgi:hypothetical protein